MVAAPTLLAQDHSVADATSYDTGIISPTSGALVLAYFSSGQRTGSAASPSSVTGCGLTWTEVASEVATNGNIRGSLWIGEGTPSSDFLTATYPEAQENCLWTVVELPGATLVRAEAAAASGAPVSLTLSGTVDGANAVLGFGSVNNGQATSLSEGATYTALGVIQRETTAPVHCHFAEYDLTGTTTVDMASTVSSPWVLVGAEVADAAAPPNSGSASGTLTLSGSATGSTAHEGDATGVLALTGGATGATAHEGAASGALALSGSAEGSTVHSGEAEGTLTLTGTATGDAPAVGTNSGAASGALTLSGTATGSTEHRGQATGDLTLTGSATGAASHEGTTTGELALTGSAEGATAHRGSASGDLILSGSATGNAPIIGGRDLDIVAVSPPTSDWSTTEPATVPLSAQAPAPTWSWSTPGSGWSTAEPEALSVYDADEPDLTLTTTGPAPTWTTTTPEI